MLLWYRESLGSIRKETREAQSDTVIPAKAGIQSYAIIFVAGLDSRFRGNDGKKTDT